MADVRLCKDCKHYQPYEPTVYSTDGSLDKCGTGGNARYLVRGISGSFCEVERSENWLAARLFNRCGREARWFEPRAEAFAKKAGLA